MRLVIAALLSTTAIGIARQPPSRKADPPPKVAPMRTDADPVPAAQPKAAPKTPADEAFEKAWAVALDRSAKLDEMEPEQTKKALAILTPIEQIEAQQALAASKTVPFLIETSADLHRFGLTARGAMESRKFAIKDPDCKAAARAFWTNEGTPADRVARIVATLHLWGVIGPAERTTITRAVQTGSKAVLDPPARNSVLRMGGRAWLESH